MKDKVLKIILIISSLPFIWVLIEAIKYVFFGVSTVFFGDQTLNYGFDAFLIGIVFRTALLIQIGILPICLAYQLFYLIRYIVKNNKIDKALKIIFIISLILLLFSSGPVLLACLAYQLFYIIRYLVKKKKSKELKNVEENDIDNNI